MHRAMRRSRVVVTFASLFSSVALVGLFGSTALADGPAAPTAPAATEPVMPTPVAADAQTTNNLVTKVQSFYDKTTSFRTPFTQ